MIDEQKYATAVQVYSFRSAIETWLDARNREWSNSMIASDERGEVMNRFQLTSHLFKWAVQSRKIDGNQIPPKVGVAQRDHYVAALYHRTHTDRVLIGQEATVYFARKAEERRAELNPPTPPLLAEPVKAMREPGDEGPDPLPSTP